MAGIRRARMTNEELARIATGHRMNASEEQSMSWPNNSADYLDQQAMMAEVFEELLARREADEPRP